MLVILNLPLIGIWIKLLTVPYRFLFPAITLFCCIGVYSLNNSNFDVYMTAIFAVVGYLFYKLSCEPAPLLLGFILGPMMEENLRRALLLSRGDWSTFVTRPLSAGAADRGGAADRDRHAAGDQQEARSRVPRRRLSPARARARPARAYRRGHDHRFDWTTAYPSTRVAGLRAQHRLHLASARRAGRAAHDPAGRQRRRRGDRRRGVMTHRRAVQQRPRLRRVLHPLGRQASCTASTPRARRRRPGRRSTSARKHGADAHAPPKRGWDSVTVPGAVAGWVALSRALRQAAVRRPAGAGDRDRRARLRGADRRAAEVGRGDAAARARSRAWPRPSCRTAARPRSASASRSRPRRARCGRSPRRAATRSTAARSPRPRRAHARANGGAMTARRLRRAIEPEWVEPIGIDYRGHRAARDPAQRAGHRGADRARHPAPLRPRRRCRSTAPSRSTCRSRR